MIVSDSCRNILKMVNEEQILIHQSFGNAKPHLHQIPNVQLLYYFNGNAIRNCIFKMMDHVLHKQCVKVCVEIVELLFGSRVFLHFCRLLAYLIHDTWIPENGEAEGLTICTSVIAHTIEYVVCKMLHIGKKILNKYINGTLIDQLKTKRKKKISATITSEHIDNYLKKTYKNNLIKIHNMISVNHPRHTCLLSKSRYTLQYKPLTNLKRKLCSDENSLVTKRIKRGLDPDSIYDSVYPSVNIVYQLSIIELCFMQAAKLSSSSLFSFLMSLQNIQLDVDVNYVVSGLIDMARNRLRVKFLEVNQEHCTCHTKCTGYNLSNVLREEIEFKGLKRHTTIFCCQRCMLTPLVWNTRAHKPRIKICASNPSIETCSLDNCSTFRDVALYTAEYGGFGRYKYQHLFYTTNILNIIEELSGKKSTGPASQLYGMCYGGSRICQARLKSNICSSRKTQNQYISCRNRERYMCTTCIKNGHYAEDYQKMRSCLFGKNAYDIGSCIDKSLNDLELGEDIKTVLNKICTGCKIKFLCSHTSLAISEGVISVNATSDPLLYKRAIKRAFLVYKVRYYIFINSK